MSHHEKRELIRLSRNGNAVRLSALLAKGIEVNWLHNTGMTPLMTAAYAGHARVVEMLLKTGALPNMTAEDGASALHWASRNGHEEIVGMLLAAGANVNARREADGPAPVHMAITSSHDSIAITLIDAGTRLDMEYLGRSLEEYAKWRDLDAVVKHLQEKRCRG